jgi:hypothetical protein
MAAEPKYEIVDDGDGFVVLIADIPKVTMDTVELDVTSTHLALKDINSVYSLHVVLPRKIDQHAVKAKWKKKKGQLHVTMPVCAPEEGAEQSVEQSALPAKSKEERETAPAPKQFHEAADNGEELLRMADQAKDEGNQLFKAKKFAKAIAKYTEAVELLPPQKRTAVYLSNRAMAHLKVEAYGCAMSDAQEALGHDPKYIKVKDAIARAD